MSAAHPTLDPETLLAGGKYRIERVLGQGGFGITYLAEDLVLGRRVAIKEFFLAGSGRSDQMVQPHPSQADQFRARKDRFLEEARTLARFRHPGIVAVFEVFEAHGTAYMVMEYLEGQSLRQTLNMAGGVIQQAKVIEYATAVGAALDAVHAEGLLHRDVKPDNIMITHDGRAVLIDFGTARQFSVDQSSQMSQTLSPGYAPPEQYAESGRFGPATDVYALGATLYDLLAGVAPASSMDRMLGTVLDPPVMVNPALAPHVSDAVAKAMNLEPADRYQSAEVFVAALSEAGPAPRDVGPTVPVLPPASPPPGSEARAERGSSEGDGVQTPARPRRGGRLWLLLGVLALSAAVAALVVVILSTDDELPVVAPPEPSVTTSPTTTDATTTSTPTSTPVSTSTALPPIPSTIPPTESVRVVGIGPDDPDGGLNLRATPTTADSSNIVAVLKADSCCLEAESVEAGWRRVTFTAWAFGRFLERGAGTALCPAETWQLHRVVDIEPDDPDGGLNIRTSPDSSSEENIIAVFKFDAENICGRPAAEQNGYLPVFVQGWVDANYVAPA